MRYPPLQKECEAVCDARAAAQNITFRFTLQSNQATPHTAIEDLKLKVLGPRGKRAAVKLESVLADRRRLTVVVSYRPRLAELVGAEGARVHVERRFPNGSDLRQTWVCRIVSVRKVADEGGA